MFLEALMAGMLSYNPYQLDNVRFDKDVKPIFKNYCVECHKGITNYEVATKFKGKIFDKVVNKKQMPPNFRLKLSDYEVEVVKKWIEGGAKK